MNEPEQDGPPRGEDIRAAAEVHRELGPDYSDAVAASFLEKVDRAVAARVDARLAGAPPGRPPQGRPPQRDHRRGLWTGIMLAVAVIGIPLILLTRHGRLVRQMAATGHGPGGTVTRVVIQSTAVRGPAPVSPGWLLLWLVVLAVCAAGAVRAWRRTAGRGLR
jgi:hypothetical protein